MGKKRKNDCQLIKRERIHYSKGIINVPPISCQILKNIQCNFVSSTWTYSNSSCSGFTQCICVREICHVLQQEVIFKALVLIRWAWNALECFPWVLSQVPLHTSYVQKYLRDKNTSPSHLIFIGLIIKRGGSGQLFSRRVTYREIYVLGGLWPGWRCRKRIQSHSHTAL